MRFNLSEDHVMLDFLLILYRPIDLSKGCAMYYYDYMRRPISYNRGNTLRQLTSNGMRSANVTSWVKAGKIFNDPYPFSGNIPTALEPIHAPGYP